MVLGDEIGTLEKHYAELLPNDAQRLAFEKAFKMSSWISSEGTVQPEGLKRPRGLDSLRVVDAGESRPLRKLEKSSSLYPC